MKTLLIGLILLNVNSAFAGSKDKLLKRLIDRALIHADKRPIDILREPLAHPLANPLAHPMAHPLAHPLSESEIGEPDAPQATCEPQVVHEARVLLASCSQQIPGGPGGSRPPQGGGIPGPADETLSRCVGEISGILSARQRTGREQDMNEAVNLCNRGIRIECVIPAKDFLANRRGTTRDEDINQAVAYCAGGRADQSCLVQTYQVLSERRGTSKDQDINDSLKACSR